MKTHSTELILPEAGRLIVDRRTALAGAAALLCTLAVARPAGAETSPTQAVVAAADAPPVPTPQFEEAFAKIVGNGTPREELLELEMPEDAENGNIVPYRISIESPMTPDDYIARVHLLSTQNPQAAVATFHFTPRSGKATVAGRMRLARTQDVVAVALTSANSLLIGRRMVHVGIGGCATE